VNANALSLTGGESPIRKRADFRQALLSWYDAFGRDLPWRVRDGGAVDPYRVWLSEIMLQQTTVAAVRGYFLAFTARWPSVEALAQAPGAQVMQAWAGLGYYSRARNLMAASRLVAAQGWPPDEAGLRALPGVGAYTAAAIAAIAYDQQANVVDGNVERVIARLFAITTPLPVAKSALRAAAADLAVGIRPGDYAQALMDLGSTVCTPRAPRCESCPVARFCAGRAAGLAAGLPAKTAKPARPQRHGVAFLAVRQGQGLLVRRPPRGLLGGMLALPCSAWTLEPATTAAIAAAAPVRAAWTDLGAVTHIFTHFSLQLHVWRADIEGQDKSDGDWRPLAALESAGLPTVFKKAVRLGLGLR
jgi:A/G-specific adenine glycosylase